MSLLTQFIIASAAVCGALIFLWNKVIRPGIRFMAQADEMLPLLKSLTEQFKGSPNSFSVLNEIVKEFRTDSGSSLRDVVNRLEKSAEENFDASILIKQAADNDRQLAAEDRQVLRRMITEMHELYEKMTAMENADRKVADDLTARQEKTDAL